MTGPTSGALERIILVAEGDETLTVGEFRDILEDMETKKKYSTESYNMFCASEDIVVICEPDTEEFVQIEMAIDGADQDEVTVTRDR